MQSIEEQFRLMEQMLAEEKEKEAHRAREKEQALAQRRIDDFRRSLGITSNYVDTTHRCTEHCMSPVNHAATPDRSLFICLRSGQVHDCDRAATHPLRIISEDTHYICWMSGKILAPVIHDVIVSKTPDQGGGSGIRVKGRIQHHRGQIFSDEMDEDGGGGGGGGGNVFDNEDDIGLYGPYETERQVGYGGMADGYRGGGDDEDGDGDDDDNVHEDEEEDEEQQRYRHQKGKKREEQEEEGEATTVNGLPPRKKVGRPRGRPPKKNTAVIGGGGGKAHLSRLATLITPSSSKKKKKKETSYEDDDDEEEDDEEESFCYDADDDDIKGHNDHMDDNEEQKKEASIKPGVTTIVNSKSSNRPYHQSNVSTPSASGSLLTTDGLRAKLTTRVETILTKLLSLSCQKKVWELQLKTIEGQVRTRVQNEIRSCNGSKKGRISDERRRQIEEAVRAQYERKEALVDRENLTKTAEVIVRFWIKMVPRYQKLQTSAQNFNQVSLQFTLGMISLMQKGWNIDTIQVIRKPTWLGALPVVDLLLKASGLGKHGLITNGETDLKAVLSEFQAHDLSMVSFLRDIYPEAYTYR